MHKFNDGKDISVLLTGKFSFEQLDNVEYLTSRGYVVPAKYITDSFVENKNTDKKIDFILKSLK